MKIPYDSYQHNRHKYLETLHMQPDLSDLPNMSMCDLVAISSMFSLQTTFMFRGKEVYLTKNELINNILETISTGNRPKDIQFKDYPDNGESLNEDSYILFQEYKSNNVSVCNLLSRLSNGKFRFDEWSKNLLRESWKTDKLLTYREFINFYMNKPKIIKPKIRHFPPVCVFAFVRDKLKESSGTKLYRTIFTNNPHL